MNTITIWNQICDEAIKIRERLQISQREFAHWMIHSNQFYQTEIFRLRGKIKSMGFYDLYSTYQKSCLLYTSPSPRD